MLKEDVKWIFFDVGSTLIDETEALNHRIRDAIQGTDISFEQFNAKSVFFAKQNLKGDLSAIRYFGLNKSAWHQEDELPYSEAQDTLQYLSEHGYRIGVIANQSPGTAKRLERWGLLKYIDIVAASAELGVAKPDSAIFEQALKLVGCDAHEAVMVGDRLDNDIAPAKKLGMNTVWIQQGFAIYQKPESAEYEPDYTINHLSMLEELL